MNDLIKIEQTQINGAEVNSVNSRHIYEYLEIDTAYTTWFNRTVDKYGFEENMDFIPILKESNGGRPEKIFIVTMDMAKELCMVSNTEKGKEVRKYFIQIEKQANKPLSLEDLLQANMKMISDLQNKVVTLEDKVTQDKPKVAFADAITGTTSHIDFETFAKALYDTEGIKMGRNKLMAWFRNNKYLTSKNKPYQVMLDRGLMSLKEGSYVNQATQELVTYTQPRITGKGQMYFTNKLLDEVTI